MFKGVVVVLGICFISMRVIQKHNWDPIESETEKKKL